MHLENDRIDKGKKIIKGIIIIYLLFLALIIMKSLKKFELIHSGMITVMIHLFFIVTFFKGNKISECIVVWQLFYITLIMPIMSVFYLFSEVLHILNVPIGIATIVLSMYVIFFIRRRILREDTKDYYEDFMKYQRNKRNKRVYLMEKGAVVVGIIYVYLLK